MTRRPLPGAVADLGVVLLTFAGVGALGGLLWWLVVEPAELTRTPEGSVMGEAELAQQFASDGWYAVIAVVAGFLTGMALAWWRARDFLLTTVLLVPGAATAAAVMAWTGRVLGPSDPDAVIKDLPRGATVPVELVVSATPSYLMWPIAALVGALMVLWSTVGVAASAAPPRSGHPSGDSELGAPTAP